MIDRFFNSSSEDEADYFYNATEILEFISKHTSIKLSVEKIGKALRHLEFNRISKKIKGKVKHGYWIKLIN